MGELVRSQTSPNQVIVHCMDLRRRECSCFWIHDCSTTESCKYNLILEEILEVSEEIIHLLRIQLTRIPEGTSSEDHTLRSILSDRKGGQFMTGKTVLPESTGPKPLLRPATAISTTYGKRNKKKLVINENK